MHTYAYPWGRLSGCLQSSPWQTTLCVASYLMWWFASKETGVVIHDTEFPYWNQVSLKNTTQTFISTSNQVYSYLFQVQTMPGSNGHPSCNLLCWIHPDLHLYKPIWQVLSHLFKFWIVGKITTHLCLMHAITWGCHGIKYSPSPMIHTGVNSCLWPGNLACPPLNTRHSWWIGALFVQSVETTLKWWCGFCQ